MLPELLLLLAVPPGFGKSEIAEVLVFQGAEVLVLQGAAAPVNLLRKPCLGSF